MSTGITTGDIATGRTEGNKSTFITELDIATFISVGYCNKDNGGEDFNRHNCVGHCNGQNFVGRRNILTVVTGQHFNGVGHGNQ